ncbi:MAG: hypothetical protein V3T72_04405 [Thermoanaerobaculia bacterium]
MKRYDITHWADLVRGIAEPEDELAMRTLLAAASTRDRRDEELLRRVATVGYQESVGQVPASAVRIAKALGSVRRTRSSERRLPFRILFDSLGQPAVAGVRGSQPSDRHLVVEAGDFVVDVRFEPGEPSRLGGASGAAVTGQVLRREDSQPLAETAVLVLAGDEAVGASLTSDSGEFQADGLPDGPLDLWVRVGRDQSIGFPLSAA